MQPTAARSPAAAPAPMRWPAVAFTVIALIAALFAFVGLGRSNYWTDELFTLHVIGHDGGLAEVLRRALTDTHPPLYYFLLYGWSKLGGTGEAWLRLPSAVAAVAALAVTALALRRRFSASAIGFALAVAATSMFFFENAQNARGYALAMLCSATLLGSALTLRERCASRAPGRWWWMLLLAFTCLAGSLVHSYLLLVAGMVLAWLLLGARDWGIRAAVVATGMLVLAINFAYTRMLLHSTTQDLHNLWFGLGARFFAGQANIALRDLLVNGSKIAGWLLLIAAIVRLLRPRAAPLRAHINDEGGRAASLAIMVYLGITVSGIAICYLIAPSFSSRNLLTASPFAWTLLAWLYDAAGPRRASLAGRFAAAMLVLLVAANLPILRGRFVERNEAWRSSAAFVARMPGCQGQPVAVMQPYKFGPATPAYRQLAAQDFYGHYAPAGMHISAWLPSELSGRSPVPALSAQLAERAAAASTGGCTLLLWGVHDLTTDSALELAEELARAPGVAPARVVVQSFLRGRRKSATWRPVEDGFVFYAIPPAAAGAPLRDPGPLLAMPRGELGDRYIVSHLFAYDGTQGPAYTLDGYSLQHVDARHGSIDESFPLVPRATCNPPMHADADVRPDASAPGCFPRPLSAE